MSFHGIIASHPNTSRTLKHTDTAVKPHQTVWISLSSVACFKAKKPKTMRLPYRKQRPPSTSQSLMENTDASPSSSPMAHPSLTARGQKSHSVPETHRGVQKTLVKHDLLLSDRHDATKIILFLCSRFLPRVYDVTLSRLRKQQLHYRGGVI